MSAWGKIEFHLFRGRFTKKELAGKVKEVLRHLGKVGEFELGLKRYKFEDLPIDLRRMGSEKSSEYDILFLKSVTKVPLQKCHCKYVGSKPTSLKETYLIEKLLYVHSRNMEKHFKNYDGPFSIMVDQKKGVLELFAMSNKMIIELEGWFNEFLPRLARACKLEKVVWVSEGGDAYGTPPKVIWDSSR